MKLQWQKPDRTRREIVRLGLSAALLGVIVLLPLDRMLSAVGYRCLFREATGWPCIFCGATRAAVRVGGLDLAGAFRINPLAAAACVALLVYVPLAVLSRILGLPWPTIREVRRTDIAAAFAIGAGLLVGNWLYMILGSTS